MLRQSRLQRSFYGAEDGVNGWFIERDPADLARRLSETSRDELRVMGEAAAAAAKPVDRDAFGLSWRRFYDDWMRGIGRGKEREE